MSELSMLLYTSQASPGLDEAAVDALAAQAQVCNTEADITSALLVHGGRVLHAMEGPSSAVQACYARIAADSRHSQVNLLSQVPCQQRRFAGWRLRRVRVHASLGPAWTRCWTSWPPGPTRRTSKPACACCKAWRRTTARAAERRVRNHAIAPGRGRGSMAA
jgi:hypothetical protein